jgi:hypothetical protein
VKKELKIENYRLIVCDVSSIVARELCRYAVRCDETQQIEKIYAGEENRRQIDT